MNKLLFAVATLAVIAPVAMFASSDDSSRGWESESHRSVSHSGMIYSTGSMGTDAMMAAEMRGLHMAMMQLSPTDHATLVKMIKDYLLSKGIDPAKYAEIKTEIKDIRKDTRSDIKDMRKQALEAAKAKREAMRANIKALRGNTK